MKRTKTLLTPESQWDRTVAYFMQLNRSRPVELGPEGVEQDLCFFRGTHPLVRNGDVLLATSLNGMAQRYGMTGITSKGVRLKNYHLPLRRGFEQVQLPDDFAGRQWNDPVIGRYVADLRASRRGRVSAYSPAPSHCKTFSGVDTSRITWFGLYKSGRRLQSTRNYDHRHYLRFFPDGSVVYTYDFNHQGSGISYAPNSTSPKYCGDSPRGSVRVVGDHVMFDLYRERAL